MREFCFRHNLWRYAGEQCARCAAETGTPQRRDTINTLEARIADLETRLLSTNRQLSELQHARQFDQAAQNALATAAAQLRTLLDQLAAHTRPNEDLLP
jgi:exonuclease VII small subunit